MIGSSTNLRVRDTSSPLCLSTMEMSKMDTNMVKEFSSSTTGIDTKACIRMENLKVRALMLGVMDRFTRENSKMG